MIEIDAKHTILIITFYYLLKLINVAILLFGMILLIYDKISKIIRNKEKDKVGLPKFLIPSLCYRRGLADCCLQG